jgi:hypothetical protein
MRDEKDNMFLVLGTTIVIVMIGCDVLNTGLHMNLESGSFAYIKWIKLAFYIIALLVLF